MTEEGVPSTLVPAPIKVRWFRKWWSILLLLLLFLSSLFGNQLAATGVLALLLLIVWTGPVSIVGRSMLMPSKVKVILTLAMIGLLALAIANDGKRRAAIADLRIHQSSWRTSLILIAPLQPEPSHRPSTAMAPSRT